MRVRQYQFITIFILLFVVIACKSKPEENAGDNESPVISSKPEKLGKAAIKHYKIKLAELFDSGLIKRNFNGSLLVAKGGNILYEQYIGYKNPETRTDTIDAETPFHLASTSKPFTGVAVLKLIQDGYLTLDEEITKFFPQFPYAGITIKQLLSHRSGLPNYLYFMDDKLKWPPAKMISNQDVLDFLISFKPPLNYKPGTHFSYCNTNFVLLALIVEKLTGKSFPRYLKETIFDPLQMTSTFVHTPADSFRTIMSYKPSGALWADDIFENTYGDKNVYSTPRDMLKWDRALYDEKFINQQLLDSAFQPQSLETPSIHNYGLGWRMLNLKNGKKVIYHFGKWHGFTPAFTRLIDEQAVIIILGNRFNKNIYLSAKMAYNIFGNYFDEDSSEQDEEISTSTGPQEMPAETPKKQVAKKRVPQAPQKVEKNVKPPIKSIIKKNPVTSIAIMKSGEKVSAKKKAVPKK